VGRSGDNKVRFEDSVEMRYRMEGIAERDHSWIGSGEIVNEVRSVMGTRDLGKGFPIHYYKSNILHYMVQDTIKTVLQFVATFVESWPSSKQTATCRHDYFFNQF